MRGSVRALLSVRFSALSASRNELRSLAKMSIPPGSMDSNPSSLRSTYSDARCFVPASVEHKRAIGKIESCQTLPSRQFCSLLSPVQAAGNHQMQRQPEIALHPDDYSLANPPQFTDNVAFHLRN